MSEHVKPEKKSDIDPNFQDQMNEQQSQAKDEGENRVKQEQTQWNFPKLGDKWKGDLFDWQGMGEPFNRDQANKDYEKATKKPKKPGKTGDIVATTTQIELLATMERAFRARHCARFPRMIAHMTGIRRHGHGGDKGVFTQSFLDYVQTILKKTGQ